MSCEIRIKSEYIQEVRSTAKVIATKYNVNQEVYVQSGNLVIRFSGDEAYSYGAAKSLQANIKRAYNIDVQNPINERDKSKTLYIGIDKGTVSKVVSVVNSNQVNSFRNPNVKTASEIDIELSNRMLKEQEDRIDDNLIIEGLKDSGDIKTKCD